MQKNTKMKFNENRYKYRWFSYLDLLGFTNLVSRQKIEEVVSTYSEVLDNMPTNTCLPGAKKTTLLSSWFSDTFIIYTGGDSLDDFENLEKTTRNFFNKLISRSIPVRGCITHGKLYSQAKKNIFIGSALINAHDYGEALNWIGLCLTPHVKEKLKNQQPLTLEKYYKQISKSDVLRKFKDTPLYAYAFNDDFANAQNKFRDTLAKMKLDTDVTIQKKYDNTLEFIDTPINHNMTSNMRCE